MRAIYGALKKRGFRETYWQFVYPGQIGGLIKSPRHQLFEFHVRFFEDGRIYAEFEIGRSAILHFLIRRCYLNNYIAIKIRSDLSETELAYFFGAVDKYKLVAQRNWQEWSGKSRFMDKAMKRKIVFFSAMSDWRVLFFAMLLSVAAVYAQHIVVLPILAAIMIVIYLIAPKRY